MSGLPRGWAEASLDECTLLNPKLDHPIPHDALVSFVPMPAVNDASGEIESPQDRSFGEVSKSYTRFQTGDVIFAKITPCMENGKIAVARELTNNLGCGSTEFHVLRPLPGMSADYIWRFLGQKSFRADAERAMTGAVGQRRVPLEYLRTRTIPIAPAPEQRRIVAKIDSLSANSRRARDHLDHIPRLVEKYKQAILAAAFRGELTREWRGASVGKQQRERQPLAEICDPQRPITYGVIKLGSEVPGGVPCLRTSNVRWLRIDTGGMKRISPELSSEYGRTILRGGEVLVNVRGTLGGVAVAQDTMSEWNVSREVAVAAVDAKRVEPQYVAYWIGADASQRWLNRVEKGVAYTGINIEDLRKLPVEFPSIDEQREVARRIETAFTWIDRLAAEAASAAKLLAHLDAATLAKAFRGELVPHDPTDEPAPALLERIGAQRQSATARPRRAGRRSQLQLGV